MGTGDEVPEAIRQLGANLTMLDAGRRRVRRSVEVLDDRARHPRVREARRRARLQPAAARLRARRRPPRRAVQQGGDEPARRRRRRAAAGGGFVAAGPRRGRGARRRGGTPPRASRERRRARRAGAVGQRRPRRRPPPASPYVPFPGGITSNRVSVEEAPIRVLEDGAAELNVPNRITAGRLRRLGAGARSVFLRRQRPAVHGPARSHRSVAEQSGRESRDCSRSPSSARARGPTSGSGCGGNCRPACQARIGSWRT